MGEKKWIGYLTFLVCPILGLDVVTNTYMNHNILLLNEVSFTRLSKLSKPYPCLRKINVKAKI